MSVVDAISDPTSTTTLLQAADLDSPVNIVGACAAILVYEAPSPGARRRLLDAEDNATLAEAALDALTRTFHVASGVQTALLASMVEGEAASVGTGGLVVAAALADLAGLTEAVEYAIGDSGAAVTLLDGFAALANSEGGRRLGRGGGAPACFSVLAITQLLSPRALPCVRPLQTPPSSSCWPTRWTHPCCSRWSAPATPRCPPPLLAAPC